MGKVGFSSTPQLKRSPRRPPSTQKSGIASRNPETKRNETEEQPKEDEHQSDRDRPHRRRPRGFDPSPGGRPDEGRLVQFGEGAVAQAADPRSRAVLADAHLAVASVADAHLADAPVAGARLGRGQIPRPQAPRGLSERDAGRPGLVSRPVA